MVWATSGPARHANRPESGGLSAGSLWSKGSVRSPVVGAPSAHGDQRKLRVVGSFADLGQQPGDHFADACDLRLGGAGALRTPRPGRPTMSETSWTARLRTRIATLVPPGQALPDRQPVYVASWVYVFGALTLASLVVVIGSGCVLAIGGSGWWHVSSLGHYVNSVHLWSVELLLGFIVIHLWGKFFMAAWRGERA